MTFVPRLNAFRPAPLASVWRWKKSVAQGMFASFVSRLKTSAKATAAISTPKATRNRSTPTRSFVLTRRPPRAIASSTIENPRV